MFQAPTLQILPSPDVLRVHLFRHGETVQGKSRVCRGQDDVGLSPRGEAQGVAAVAAFKQRFPTADLVLSSDLVRCRHLAGLFGDYTATPLLREQHMGSWEGRDWEEITSEDPLGTLHYWHDYVDACPPGGESYRDLYERVGAFWADLPLKNGRVVVVSHVGVIRALLARWFELGPDQALRFAPAYASVTDVLLAESGVVLERFGVDSGV